MNFCVFFKFSLLILKQFKFKINMNNWMFSSFFFCFTSAFTYYLQLMFSFSIQFYNFDLNAIVIIAGAGSLEGFRSLTLKLISGKMGCECWMWKEVTLFILFCGGWSHYRWLTFSIRYYSVIKLVCCMFFLFHELSYFEIFTFFR